MNKFWKWMEEKGYAVYHEDPFCDSGWLLKEVERQTKQMLIGYMIEYIGSILKDETNYGLDEYMFNEDTNHNYEVLVYRIEMLEDLYGDDENNR